MPKTSQRKLATDAEKEVWQRIGGYALQYITEIMCSYGLCAAKVSGFPAAGFYQVLPV
jgi:hypothetical protein